MPHTMGQDKHAIHGRALMGVDQSNKTNEGRKVVDCDGKTGRIKPDAAHCSYGATVEWDAGYTTYNDTACLWWADDPDAPQVATAGPVYYRSNGGAGDY